MNGYLCRNFDLDIGEIYTEEISKGKYKENKQFYSELYQFVKAIYLKKQVASFISAEDVQSNPSLQGRYDNYYFRLQRNLDKPLDFFEYKGAFYDMQIPCVVTYTDVREVEFKYLFTLKLRYFENALHYLFSFLLFHQINSFGNNEERFHVFLQSILRKHKSLIGPQVKFGIKDWLQDDSIRRNRLLSDSLKFIYKNECSSTNKLTLEMSSVLKGEEREDAYNPLFFEPKYEHNKGKNKIEAIDVDLKEIPEPLFPQKTNYRLLSEDKVRHIEGYFTDEEVRYFFSFLYVEKSSTEGSFLPKEAVDHMLRHGIAIPEKPLDKKFSLNCTRRNPKKCVDYFIHQFRMHYNAAKKREIFEFLGSYISDYEKALNSITYTRYFRNLTGEKPIKRMSLDINRFLPKRFQIKA